MTELLDRIWAQFAQSAVICHAGNSTEGKVFLQLLPERGDLAPYEVTSLGTVDDRLWLCLSRTELEEGNTLTAAEVTYRVHSCAPVFFGGEVCHWRAILKKERVAAT